MVRYKTTKKFSRERIKSIQKLEKQGKLTAVELVEQAEDINHPWHDEIYKKNENQAAYFYRLQIAREIINQVKIIINKKEFYAYENVSVKVSKDEEVRQYVSRPKILRSDYLRKQVIAAAYKELKNWRKKYRDYKEFDVVFKEIDEMESVKEAIV